jgi:integrase/recombinase XerC
MSPAWVTAIEQFLNYMRAAGQTVASVDSRRSHLQHLARRIEADPFDVTGQHLVAWFGRQTWAQETRRGRRTSYQVFYDWAVREELTSTNPASKLPTVKGAKPRPRPIPRSAFDQAVRGSDARVRLMLRLAYDAGLRRCEIAVIHSSDLIEDLVGWSLLVHGKGNKERVVPLTPRLALELRSLPPGWAFPGDYDGHLSPRWVGKLATTVLPDHWTLHTLRHSFATRNYAVKRDVLTTQQLLGHASPATTQLYVQLPSDSLRESVMAAASGL